MAEDLNERLAKAAGSGARMSDYVDQVVTVLSIEKEPSPFTKGETSVKATVLAGDDEVTFYTTPTATRQLLEIEDEIPCDLRIESFPGQFGKTGYKFIAPND